MPWVPKAGVPAYISVEEYARAAIAGGPSEWITNYFWMVSNRTVETAAFCASGPRDCAPLTLLDFVGFVGATKVTGGLSLLGLVPKLACFIDDRVFSSICELRETIVCSSLGTFTGSTDGGHNLVGNFPIPDCDWLAARHVGSVGTGGHIVYWSTTSGEFQNNVPHDGRPNTDDQGVVWWTYPWSPERNYVWINVDVPYDSLELAACLGQPSIETNPPPEFPRPPELPAEPDNPYTTIPQLGAELDRIEQKLHLLINMAVANDIEVNVPPVEVEPEPVPVEPDEEVELDENILGIIVTVSAVPAATDLRFGEPERLNKVGRVTFGTEGGWLMPQWIHVSPQVFLDLPAGTNKVRIHVLPPATASYVKLKKAVEPK